MNLPWTIICIYEYERKTCSKIPCFSEGTLTRCYDKLGNRMLAERYWLLRLQHIMYHYWLLMSFASFLIGFGTATTYKFDIQWYACFFLQSCCLWFSPSCSCIYVIKLGNHSSCITINYMSVCSLWFSPSCCKPPPVTLRLASSLWGQVGSGVWHCAGCFWWWGTHPPAKEPAGSRPIALRSRCVCTFESAGLKKSFQWQLGKCWFCQLSAKECR